MTAARHRPDPTDAAASSGATCGNVQNRQAPRIRLAEAACGDVKRLVLMSRYGVATAVSIRILEVWTSNLAYTALTAGDEV